MLSDSYILKQYKFEKQTLNFNCNLRESFCINSLRKISKVKTAYWGVFFRFSCDTSPNSTHHGNFQREKDLYWSREEVGVQGCDWSRALLLQRLFCNTLVTSLSQITQAQALAQISGCSLSHSGIVVFTFHVIFQYWFLLLLKFLLNSKCTVIYN